MTVSEYADFELKIEASEEGLQITVVQSPAGTGTAKIAHPFNQDEVLTIMNLLSNRSAVSRNEKLNTLREFGDTLFNAIFTETSLGQLYDNSLKRAAPRGLRIRLNLEAAGPYADLPWELMRDPRSDFLALYRQTPLVRYLPIQTRPAIEIRLPLRVLVVIAGPRDLQPIDIEAEWRMLNESTAAVQARGLLHLERLESAQLIHLQRKLGEGTPYQVLHFIGHADPNNGGMLILEDMRRRSSAPYSAQDLGRELAENNTVRLMVLNSEPGSRDSLQDPYATIANSILRSGLPAVVATQYPLGDDASRLFTGEFYRLLAEGHSLEVTMTDTRRMINTTLGNVEWAPPALFMGNTSEYLFPRRRSHSGRASTGGLRDRLPILVGMLLVLFLGLFGITQLLNRPSTPTPTVVTNPTPLPTPADVDLSVVSMRLTPPDPAPGQLVSVQIQLRNLGKDPSGEFGWTWFIGNPDMETATLFGTVPNLNPKDSITVQGITAFGVWGDYLTTAFVNDGAVTIRETRYTNNTATKLIRTVNRPFVIDFSLLPTGLTPTQLTTLTKDSFITWGFSLAPDVNAAPDCATASLNIDNTQDEPRLTVGLPENVAQCTSVPIIIAPETKLSQQMTQMMVDVIPTQAGDYTMTLFNADNAPVGNSVKVTAKQADVDQKQVLSLSTTRNMEGLRAVVQGPPNTALLIRRITFNPKP